MTDRLGGRVSCRNLWCRTRRVVILTGTIAALCACDSPNTYFTQPSPTTTLGSPSPPGATHALTGVVSETTAEGSQPLAGAQVLEEPSGRTAVTNADGVYEITGLQRPSVAVSANKAGYVTVRKVVALTADARVDLEVTTLEGQTLSGVVFETIEQARVPIAGVSVYCDSCGSPFGHTFAQTDAAGTFSFGWANNGAIPLLVSKEGYRLAGNASPADARVVATVSGSTRFDIELVRQ